MKMTIAEKTLWHIVNVEGVITKGEKILMAKRSMQEDHEPGTYAFIGGKVESSAIEYEQLEKTLLREIKEEVNIDVIDLRYVTSSSFVSDKGDHVIDIVFICAYNSGEPTPMQVEETEEVVWMSKEEILAHENVNTWTKHVITLLK